jgi:Trk-type K+ transport system membrane component
MTPAVKRRDQKKREVQPRVSPPPRPIEPADGESIVWRFVGIYLLLVLIGFIVFRHPSTMVGGNEMSVDRAMFTSVNTVTLTGFQQTLALDEYRLPGKIAALLLTIGGTLTTLIAGGMAVTRIARMALTDRTIIIAACALEAVAIVIGAITLPGHGRGVFEAIFQAVSAFGHSGLHMGTLPDVTDGRTHVVLLPLSLLGAVGVPVLLGIAHSVRRRAPLHRYARLALMLWAGSYVLGFVALTLLSGGTDGWLGAMATASVQAINSRTTGLPFPVGDARPGHWVLIILMAVGGVSGAAAGGIKLTTLWTIWTGGRAAMRGQAPGRVFAIALTWLGLYGLIVFVPLLFLLATEPGQPGDRLLFLVVSAVSNVGLAQNPVSIVGPGMFVLSAAMLLGRILPLAILWWVVDVARDEDDVPVG